MRYHSSYNVEQFLQDYRIDYVDRGKNVGRDSVNIACIRCDDKSYHLGIHRTGGYFHCWRCGYSGNFIKLVHDLLKVDWNTARRITRKYGVGAEVEYEEIKIDLPQVDYYKFYDYPKGLKKHRDYALYYLKKRYCPADYLLKCGFVVNGLSFGVYLPIYFDERQVSWQIRYITHPKLRYKSAPDIDLSQYLFFYDEAKIKLVKDDTLCLVEGIFDVFAVWPIHPAVAMFTSELSKKQILLLRNLTFKKLYIIIDGDDEKGKKKAENIFLALPFIKEKYIIDLPDGEDPSSLGPDRMKEILKPYDLLEV